MNKKFYALLEDCVCSNRYESYHSGEKNKLHIEEQEALAGALLNEMPSNDGWDYLVDNQQIIQLLGVHMINGDDESRDKLIDVMKSTVSKKLDDQIRTALITERLGWEEEQKSLMLCTHYEG